MMNYHWKPFYCLIETTIKLCHWYKPGWRSCDGVVVRVHLNAWPLGQVGHWLRKRLFIIQDCENISLRKKWFSNFEFALFLSKDHLIQVLPGRFRRWAWLDCSSPEGIIAGESFTVMDIWHSKKKNPLTTCHIVAGESFSVMDIWHSS